MQITLKLQLSHTLDAFNTRQQYSLRVCANNSKLQLAHTLILVPFPVPGCVPLGTLNNQYSTLITEIKIILMGLSNLTLIELLRFQAKGITRGKMI